MIFPDYYHQQPQYHTLQVSQSGHDMTFTELLAILITTITTIFIVIIVIIVTTTITIVKIMLIKITGESKWA